MTAETPDTLEFALQTHSWEAMGTVWHVSAYIPHDFSQQAADLWQQLEQETQAFEARYSRFLPDSEVNRWKSGPPASPEPISTHLKNMLNFAQELRKKTNGAFDPAVGGLLEQAGYDTEYSFVPKNPATWQVPLWQITPAGEITCDGPIVIDVGGFGKGYWIDQLSQMLLENGIRHHLVDGGGDMFGTTKPDGSGWRTALEFPGKPDEALDVLTLKNQALAVSDTLKRRWGDWNHVVDPNTQSAATTLTSAAVVAPRAFVADAITTCLMVTDQATWPGIMKQYDAEWFVTTPEGIHWSHNWPGEFYAK